MNELTPPFTVEPRPWGLNRMLPTKIYPGGRVGGVATPEEVAVAAYIANIEAKLSAADPYEAVGSPASPTSPGGEPGGEPGGDHRVAALESEVARLQAVLHDARRGVAQVTRQTSKQKRAAVAAVLAKNPGWSSRRVARETGVSTDLVIAVRDGQRVHTEG